MSEPDHASIPFPVREDLARAHASAWSRLAAPGTWWTGAERVAIAAQARAARDCDACRARNAALSPEVAAGAHPARAPLGAPAVDAVHRIATDAGRLSERWVRSLEAHGIDDGRYVEMVGVVSTTIAVDEFFRALGAEPPPLPSPRGGDPSRYRPPGARRAEAWVPTVAPEDLADTDPDMYAGKTGAFIHRALSLVPEEQVGFFVLDDAHYLPDAELRAFDREPRAISHAQIELLAARVSARNRCVY